MLLFFLLLLLLFLLLTKVNVLLRWSSLLLLVLLAPFFLLSLLSVHLETTLLLDILLSLLIKLTWLEVLDQRGDLLLLPLGHLLLLLLGWDLVTLRRLAARDLLFSFLAWLLLIA